ncbi:unnamed protein product [Musa acuminata subsp. burmannicoides]
MGGKGGSSSPSSSPALPVCCMCGDRGLSEELFRCRSCLVRFQHKYCSNLYPRAECYRACNWCLSDRKENKPVADSSIDQINSVSSPSNSNGGFSSGNELQRCSSPSPLHLDKPIKKQRLPDKASSSSIESVRSEARTQPKQAFRGRVKRYKLLEEVSS